MSVTVSVMVSGTPWATPLAPPKLERMSLRTIPLWDRALGPLDPSPGYGPAVSSGMTAQLAAVAAVVVEVVDGAVVVDEVAAPPAASELELLDRQPMAPAAANRAAPPS